MASRRSTECYLTFGKKKFCNENGYKAGDVMKFGIAGEKTKYINVICV